MRDRLAVILAMVGLALATAAFLGPWWVYTGSNGSVLPPAMWEYGPFGWTWSGPTVASNQPLTVPGNYNDLPRMDAVFMAGAAFLAAGSAAGVATVALTILPASRRTRPRWAADLGVGSFLFFVAAVVEVAVFLPIASSADSNPLAGYGPGFWGVASTWDRSGGPLVWGPGWGWYAIATAAILFLAVRPALLRAQPGPAATPVGT